MKNMIKYIKLLKYGLQLRTMVILAVIFFALGIVYELIDFNGTGIIPFSGLYLAISGMYIYQVVITASVSSLVQTSFVKRKLQTSVPVLFTTFCLLITYTIFVILRLNLAAGRTLDADPSADLTIFYVQIFSSAVLICLILLYFAFSFRFYVVSTIVLFIVLFPTLILFARSDWSIAASVIDFVGSIIENFSHGTVIALSYAIILLGSALCYFVNVAFYRRPLSNIAYRTALRQAQAK